MTSIMLSLSPEEIDWIGHIIQNFTNITASKREKTPMWVRKNLGNLLTSLEKQDKNFSKSKSQDSENYSLSTQESEALAFAFYKFLHFAYESQRRIQSPSDRHFLFETYKLVGSIRDQHAKQLETACIS